MYGPFLPDPGVDPVDLIRYGFDTEEPTLVDWMVWYAKMESRRMEAKFLRDLELEVRRRVGNSVERADSLTRSPALWRGGTVLDTAEGRAAYLSLLKERASGLHMNPVLAAALETVGEVVARLWNVVEGVAGAALSAMAGIVLLEEEGGGEHLAQAWNEIVHAAVQLVKGSDTGDRTSALERVTGGMLKAAAEVLGGPLDDEERSQFEAALATMVEAFTTREDPLGLREGMSARERDALELLQVARSLAYLLVALRISRDARCRRICRGGRKGSRGAGSARAVREKYLKDLEDIGRRNEDWLREGRSPEWRAREANRLRDEAKAAARDGLDPDIRAKLDTWRDASGHRDLTFDELVTKYEAQGLKGDAVYEEILRASQRSNQEVNRLVFGGD